jgi:hypothetical protein
LAAFATTAGAAEKPAAAAPKPAAQAPQAPNGGKGKVLETMNSGGYTYVKVDIGGQAIWAAAPQTKVKKGDMVTVPPGAPMPNFRSETLNRTFDLVYFVGGLEVGGTSEKAPKAEKGKDARQAQAPHTKPQATKTDVTGVKKAEGGKTVAEIYGERKSLAGTEVAVRGKVVKFSSGIMNKNWLHIQDGTGQGATGDLVVTTDGTAGVGDVVLIRGKVAADKDFGFGYRYDVIVEEAKISKE